MYILDILLIRGRATGRAGGRGIDDPTSVASIQIRGRGWRGRGLGIAIEGFTPFDYVGNFGGLPPWQAMAMAMRDVTCAIRGEIQPLPLPRSLRREASPDPIEVRFRHYIDNFERRNLPTFTGGYDVMIAEDWL